MIKIDVGRHEVKVSGRQIRLNPKEFQILLALKGADGNVLSRDQIFYKVWGYSKSTCRSITTSRTIDTHMGRLRAKIGIVSKRAMGLIVTVPKRGYKLESR